MCLRFPLLSSSSSMPNSFPTSLRIGGDGLLYVRSEVLRGASGQYRGRNHSAGSHLKVGDQTPGAVALVLMLLAFRRPRAHRKCAMKPLQSLDAVLLVGGDYVHPFFVKLRRLCVALADGVLTFASKTSGSASRSLFSQ